LNQNNINDKELKILNKESENMQSLLLEKKLKFKSLVFDNQLIEFKSNEDEINEFELGEIEWRPDEYPTVFIKLFYLMAVTKTWPGLYIAKIWYFLIQKKTLYSLAHKP
jgi:hypothetical protein